MLNFATVVTVACEAAQIQRHRFLILSLQRLKYCNKLWFVLFIFLGGITGPLEFGPYLLHYIYSFFRAFRVIKGAPNGPILVLILK